MRRIIGFMALALALGGCAQDTAERLKAYNDDGLALYSQGQFHDARESFEAALALQKDDPGLLYNIAQCYDHDGNVPQAERYYQECLAHDPSHVAAHHALTKLLVRNQR